VERRTKRARLGSGYFNPYLCKIYQGKEYLYKETAVRNLEESLPMKGTAGNREEEVRGTRTLRFRGEDGGVGGRGG